MTRAHVTYQMRCYSGRQGYARFDEVLRMCQRLYNAALAERRDAWKMRRVSIGRFAQYGQLTLIRKDIVEYRSLSLALERGVLNRVDRAYQSFFERVAQSEKPGYPRFKPIQRYNTIEVDDVGRGMVKVQPDGRLLVRIKGLPVLECRVRRELPPVEDIKTIRLTRRGRRIIASLTFAVEKRPVAPSEEVVGLDMGVSSRVTTSDGEHVERKREDRRRKRRHQRRLARAKKGSRSRAKKRNMYANACYKDRIRQRNEVHRISSEIIRRYGFVAVEKLQIANLTVSASGTVEEPGVGVSAKRALNREILSQRWGMLRRQLAYKAEWAGRQYVEVSPAYTSQDCSGCGERNGGVMPRRVYHCAGCGLETDRDENAARNILRRGLLMQVAAGAGDQSRCTAGCENNLDGFLLYAVGVHRNAESGLGEARDMSLPA